MTTASRDVAMRRLFGRRYNREFAAAFRQMRIPFEVRIAVRENPDLLDLAYEDLRDSIEGIFDRPQLPGQPALGDGTFLQRIKEIIDWMSSDEGQAKIQKIIEMIMKIIGMSGG